MKDPNTDVNALPEELEDEEEFEVDAIEEDIKFDERKYNENLEMYDWSHVQEEEEEDDE